MKSYIKTIINAIKIWVGELGARIDNSQADWNENDPHADSYVKNKPKNLATVNQVDDVKSAVTGIKNIIDKSARITKIRHVVSPSHTYSLCLQAYNRGDDIIFVQPDGEEYEFYKFDSAAEIFYFRGYDPVNETCAYQKVSRTSALLTTKGFTKTTEINSKSDNMHIPTAGAVYEAIHRSGTVANFAGMTASGSYNKYSDVYELIEKNVVKSTLGSGIYCAVADSYIINKETGRYELVNPTLRQGLYSTPVGKYIMSGFTGGLYDGDAYKSKNVYKVVEQRGSNDNGWSIVVDAYTLCQENTTDRGEFVHVVGNGTSDTDRSNAHTLDWDGNAWYAGTVEGAGMIVRSSTEGSSKRFEITIDDSGTISATEII